MDNANVIKLKSFFENNRKIALGFSGGADSAYLLWAGVHYGADIKPYFVKSSFQPCFELEDAKRLCRELNIELSVIDVDILKIDDVVENTPKRCYFCKKLIFYELRMRALRDGYTVVIDGTNASDDCDDRPGMRAISELGVLSPLRICGITKDELKSLSREAGIFTWDKPSYSCLATRITAGEKISADKLRRIEEGEKILFSMGFSDFRLRLSDNRTKLQITEAQSEKAKSMLCEIKEKLMPYFQEVILDTKYR